MEGVGGEGPVMDWEPSGVGSGGMFTTTTAAAKQQAGGNTQKQRRDAEEERWAVVRPMLRDGFLGAMGSYGGLRESLMQAEADVYRAKLQELMDHTVCNVCNHGERRVWRTVSVFIITFTAVHRLELPVWVCLR